MLSAMVVGVRPSELYFRKPPHVTLTHTSDRTTTLSCWFISTVSKVALLKKYSSLDPTPRGSDSVGLEAGHGTFYL